MCPYCSSENVATAPADEAPSTYDKCGDCKSVWQARKTVMKTDEEKADEMRRFCTERMAQKGFDFGPLQPWEELTDIQRALWLTIVRA